MSRNDILEKNKEFEINEVDNSFIILEPCFEKIYVLGEIEKFIFELCDGVNTFDYIIKKICKTFMNEHIIDEIEEFINDLLSKKIIMVKSNG